jgi:hypothetical protein
MSKASQLKTRSELRMEMSQTAKQMLCGVLSQTIHSIDQGIIVDGFDVGIVCAHLRCIMNLVHGGEDWQFEAGLDGDAIRPALNKLLQKAVEDLDWKKEWGL